MGFWEIFLIVVCVCIVSGTVVAYVLRKKRESIVVATVVVANVRTVKMQKSESKEKIRKATSLEVAFLSIYCETAHKIYKNGLFVW